MDVSRFLLAYPEDLISTAAAPGWSVADVTVRDDFSDLMAEVAGRSFGGGVVRFIASPEESREWVSRVTAAFPDWDTRDLTVVSIDWRGQLLVLDHRDRREGLPSFLLFDVSSGDILQVPVSFRDFFEHFAMDDPSAFGDSELREWHALHPDEPPLAIDECIGETVPRFLGGPASQSNYERTETKFYWDITGQLRVASLGVGPGLIGGVDIRDE